MASNEVSLFNNATNVDLSYLKDLAVDDITRQLAGSVAHKRISIKGGVFRMMVSGQEVQKSPDRHLNIVVVAAAPAVSRTYYEGVYSEGAAVRPSCWSDDGVKPADSCTTKKHATCNDCPMNIKGSGQGDSKACRYSQRLAVVLANDINGEVYGLTLSATSLFGKGDDAHMPLQQYTRKLAGHGLPIRAVVTKMAFDLDSATPKLIFSAERPLSAQEFAQAAAQGESEDARMAVAPMTTSQSATPTQAAQIAAPAPAPVAETAPVTIEPTVREKVVAPTPTPAGKADINQMLADWADDD